MLSRSSWLLLGGFFGIGAWIAARVWSTEIREFETRTLDALGVPMPVRVAAIAALIGLLGYGYYAQSKQEAARLGQPVIRRSVAVFALGSLALVLGLAFYASRG